MPHRISIRPAAAGDVPAICDMIGAFAAKKLLLPRSADEVYEHLQEFIVANYDGNVVGCAAMHVYASNLAEIRSLAVVEAYQGRGIGRLLVGACEKLAAGLGIERLFALTYAPAFFYRLGYERVAKESLPHKIWTVCIHCEKFADCDEIAVEKLLRKTQVRPARIIPILEIQKE